MPWRDVNAILFALFRDLADVQIERPKKYAYGRSASVLFWLDRPIDDLRHPDGSWPKISGLGPSSMRIISEVVATGSSAKVEAAITASSKGAGWEERGASRQALLSRAGTLRALADDALAGVTLDEYRGDFQMHSEWSDGAVPIATLAQACKVRGYSYCAVTDHAKGLPVARGMTAEAARRQHEQIDQLNDTLQDFRVLKGIEANLAADGSVDVSDEERTSFDLVLAAPHANLRTGEDQTERLVRVIETPAIHILAHPRGRKVGARAGIVADWDVVFRAAAKRNVAIELDGDPSRQDLDHVLAARALEAGCLFALDSDAHNPEQLVYAETAIAHARLAGIPPARVVNCWPLGRLLDWSRLLRDR